MELQPVADELFPIAVLMDELKVETSRDEYGITTARY